MNFRHLVFLGLPLSAFLACSGSTSSSSGGGGTCSTYFQALYAYESRCNAIIAPDSTSADNFNTVCGNALAAPGAAKTSSIIETCTSTINAASCTGDDSAIDCKFGDGTGTLADGAACGESEQCTGYCKVADSTKSICGVCAPLIAVGGACTNDNSDACGSSATCDGTKCVAIVMLAVGAKCRDTTTGSTLGDCTGNAQCSAAGTCVAPAKTGEACETANDCEGNADCTASKCVALPTAGAACTAACATGLACGADGKCATPVAVALGASCDASHQCQGSFCAGSGFTTTTNPDGSSAVKQTPGTCTAYLATGAACSNDSSTQKVETQCAPFEDCVGGTCQIPDPSACK